MVTLEIRDVPDDVYDRLVAIAEGRGQSLQEYLLELVTAQAQAQRIRDRKLIGSLRDRADGGRSMLG